MHRERTRGYKFNLQRAARDYHISARGDILLRMRGAKKRVGCARSVFPYPPRLYLRGILRAKIVTNAKIIYKFNSIHLHRRGETLFQLHRSRDCAYTRGYARVNTRRSLALLLCVPRGIYHDVFRIGLDTHYIRNNAV